MNTIIYLEPGDGTVQDQTGTTIGTASGPPYTLPDDAATVVEDNFPSDHSSVSVQELMWTLAIANSNVEFGVP